MTTKEKLAKLNELRQAANMKPLKGWKESGAKLDMAIAQLMSKGVVTEKIDPPTKQIINVCKICGIKCVGHDKMTAEKTLHDHCRECHAVPQADAPKPKKAQPKKAQPEALVTIKQLCDELGLNAKVARAKLRRLQSKGKIPETLQEARWEWDVKHHDALLALLK